MSTSDVNWDQRYAAKDTPWDSGQPSPELQRILHEWSIEPCRTLELGCGTGSNAVYLAGQGFEVTAVDISPLAITRAKERARQAGVPVNFLVGDALDLPDFGRPFPLVFDRGVYHFLRRVNLNRYQETLSRVTEPGSLYLSFSGNANCVLEPGKGPPTVHAHEICTEWHPLFQIMHLREFVFDGVVVEGQNIRPLGWSVLMRRSTR
jgi:SAM-dependent methyltransferase